MDRLTFGRELTIIDDQSVDGIIIEAFNRIKQKKHDSELNEEEDDVIKNEKLKRLLIAEGEANQEAYNMYLIGRRRSNIN